MADEFGKIAQEIDAWHIPDHVEKFLHREPAPSPSDQTWGFYAHAYSAAFDMFAERVRERWRGGGLLQLPLFYFARHSVELNLKWVIFEFAEYTGVGPADQSHDLMKLWQELRRQLEAAKLPLDDHWGAHCARLIEHVHEIDKTGEAFRYPARRSGQSFDYTFVEFNGLVEAHEHITGYCSASLDVLNHELRGDY